MQRQERNRACTAKKRALATQSETLQRQEKNRACTAKKRASETQSETLKRQKQDRAHTAKKRASDTQSETLKRHEQDRARTAKNRALESKDETLQRNKKNKTAMAKKRALTVTLETAIASYLSKVKLGPEFVCTCCHRMMYKQTVVPYNKSKYTKASNKLLEQVFCAEHNYTSSDVKQWVCKTCDGALTRGLQAKANSLQLTPIPHELSGLNLLELRLISLRVPFMKMVALPSGKQRCIHGPAVNVPSKIDTILCTVLPRLPSQSELKLKRILAYRGHYMYDYISPERVMNALRWLKANNPLYADIDINEEWLQQALTNDEDLFAGMVEQSDNDDMDTESELPTQETVGKHNANHIDKDHEPSSTEQPMDTECSPSSLSVDNDALTIASNALERLARENGFTVHDVPYDGDCLFSAIAYELESIGLCSVNKSELRLIGK